MSEAESIGEWVDISTLQSWKDNPRNNTEAIQSIANSIRRFGFASPIVARAADGMIIAGHTRYEAAKLLGLKNVPVRFMNLDMNDAQLLALADNKLSEISEWDYDQLRTVLKELEQEQDLSGLGWSENELQNLLLDIQTGINNADDEWIDMPEFEHDDLNGQHTIKVHFLNEDHLQEFAKLVNQNLNMKTKSMWFPKQEQLEDGEDRY